MFKLFTEKMSKLSKKIRGLDKISEKNIETTLQDIKKIFLNADVNFTVTKNFINNIKEKSLGLKVLDNVTPGQQFIKLLYDELVYLLGSKSASLSDFSNNKNTLKVILLVGLNGAGKTTTAAKLGWFLQKNGYKVGLTSLDFYRPAAIEQLEKLALLAKIIYYKNLKENMMETYIKNFLIWAAENKLNYLIVDTAGRNNITQNVFIEIQKIISLINPNPIDTYFVSDSALGQKSAEIIKIFSEYIKLTGLILTKFEGDSSAGAALSMNFVTGIPIKFIGNGEKISNIDLFYPDRLAHRILGMGDIITLVEKSKENIKDSDIKHLSEKIENNTFDFNDFLLQLKTLKKIGSISEILAMIPGFNNVNIKNQDTSFFKKFEYIILSMTKQERRNPNIIKGNRIIRIAKGSGLKVNDVKKLLTQFESMKKILKTYQSNQSSLFKNFNFTSHINEIKKFFK